MTPTPAAARTRSLADRFYAAFPLATVYLWLLVLYGWQARRHPTPWVFLDEIKFTRIARGIADYGHPVVMGQNASLGSLATVFMAPAWWLGSIADGYAVAKWIGVACMTATLFPAYALARLVVGRWAALFAATGAVAVPALGYTVFLVQEPYAYPYATLCLFLIAKALITRRRNWVIGALVAALVAPLVRNQLTVIPAIYGLTAFALAWRGKRMRAWRAGWQAWDWVGLGVLLLGASVLFNAVMGRRDEAWLHATSAHKLWIFTYGVDALGTLVIGLGVFPLVATLLAFTPGKGRERRPEERVLAFLVAAAGFCFVYYAGIKGAFLRENFGNIVVERNVIYLAPLLFVGLALFLERPRFGGRALAVAAVAGLFLVLHTPTLLAFRGYYDAPGIEVLQGLNRWFSVTETGVRVVLVALLLLSLEAVVLLRTARPAIARAAIAALAVVAVGWSLTGEIVFAGASVAHSQSLARNMATPRSWVDETVHGKPVIFLGANMNTSSAQATLYEAEFWNRSIVRQWTIDGLAPPLPTQTPNVDAQGYLLDGLYKPIAPGFEYFLTTQDVDLDGKELVGPPDDPVADTGIVQPPGATYKLWKVRQPARLAHTTRGLTLDGWATSPDGVAPAVVSYSQFATPGWKSGYIAVALNRTAGCATAFPTEHVVIRVGPLKVDPATNIPTVGKPARTRRVVLKPCDDQAPLIPAPKAPFEVSVTIAKTYRPRDFDDRTSESRWLAAQVGFDFVGYVPVG